MNLKEIKEMINLMNENNLSELELEREGLKIRLKKGGDRIIEQYVAASPAAEAGREAPPTRAAEETKEAPLQIKSPMVGTFYRAPAAEAEPFVEVGQEIEPGQVVCIIEAMKLMNEIKAETRGRIKEILVENAEPVEFGQSLFVLEPL